MLTKKPDYTLARSLEGIPVVDLREGSPAALAGVRNGDVILCVNGVRTRDAEAYLDAKELRRDGMEVVLYRDGEAHTLEMIFQREVREVV
jgi:S1-C subfamily serine protease